MLELLQLAQGVVNIGDSNVYTLHVFFDSLHTGLFYGQSRCNVQIRVIKYKNNKY